MRLKDNFKISKNCSGDSFSVISDVTVRVIEVILDNGSKEYLATNLLDPSFTPDMFRELYFYRWLVETKYKELKSRLAIEDFNGATSVLFFRNFISLCFFPIFLLLLKMKWIRNSVFLLKVLTNTVIRLIDLISLAAWKRFFLRFYPAKLPFLPLILSFLMPAGAARRSFLAGPSAERRTKRKDVHISGILKFLFNL